MKEKIAPDVHHNIIPASPDISILDFYKGYYDCVYIILHPFMKCHDIKKFMKKEERHTKTNKRNRNKEEEKNEMYMNKT